MTWHAWHYARHRWQRIGTAAGIAAAARLLSERFPPSQDRNCALTHGAVPDWIPGERAALPPDVKGTA